MHHGLVALHAWSITFNLYLGPPAPEEHSKKKAPTHVQTLGGKWSLHACRNKAGLLGGLLDLPFNLPQSRQ